MIKRRIGFHDFLIFLSFIACAVVLMLNKNAPTLVLQGVLLWAGCVMPSLFPFFFITNILTSLKTTNKFARIISPFTKKVFRVGGAVGYAYFCSLISGYPVGAKMVSDLKLKGYIGDSESVRASIFCSTSSPAFILSSVGRVMFNDIKFGLLLFLVHFISTFITGVIFSFYRRKDAPCDKILTYSKPNDLFYQSVYSSVISVLLVGGIITLFYLLTELLAFYKILSPMVRLLTLITGNSNFANGVAFGIFECTKGLNALSKGGITFFTLPVCALLCGFGGLSIIMQSLIYLKKAQIKTAPFILSKIVCAVISFVLAMPFSMLFL